MEVGEGDNKQVNKQLHAIMSHCDKYQKEKNAAKESKQWGGCLADGSEGRLRKKHLNKCQSGVKEQATQASGEFSRKTEQEMQRPRTGMYSMCLRNSLEATVRGVREGVVGGPGGILESNLIKAWRPQKGL